MRRAPFLRLVTVLVLGATSLVSTSAAAGAAVVLRHPTEPVFWTGGPLEGLANPALCSRSACDEVKLQVDIPRAQLKGDRELQVAIRWQSESNDLDLYIYGPDAALVGQSATHVSTAESARARLMNGSYRVIVVSSGSESVTYEGLAQVEATVKPKPTRALLPDIISLPARRPHISTGAYLFASPLPGLPTGCYPEETVEQGAVRCLRFDHPLANVGDGPFEVRYRLEGAGTTNPVEQRIYRSDGTWRDRKVDTYEFHPTHAHFHYKDFAWSRLWRSNEEGARLGDEPVRKSDKNGFCMLDVDLHWWGMSGDAPRTYTPPGGCVAANELDPAGGRIAAVNGISVGWADVYFWYVPDQYIEISGVGDGYYLLETIADPMDTAIELDQRNNSALAHIQICGDAVQLVGGVGPCSR